MTAYVAGIGCCDLFTAKDLAIQYIPVLTKPPKLKSETSVIPKSPASDAASRVTLLQSLWKYPQHSRVLRYSGQGQVFHVLSVPPLARAHNACHQLRHQQLPPLPATFNTFRLAPRPSILLHLV
jgi:hypothetical protein